MTRFYNLGEIDFYCNNCNQETKMVTLGRGPSAGTCWLKCKKCSLSRLVNVKDLSEKVVQGKKIVRKDDKLKINPNAENEVRVYQPTRKFIKGEKLFHKDFNDSGKIIEIKPSCGHFEKIVVDFEKVGKKVLIHGLQNFLDIAG